MVLGKALVPTEWPGQTVVKKLKSPRNTLILSVAKVCGGRTQPSVTMSTYLCLTCVASSLSLSFLLGFCCSFLLSLCNVGQVGEQVKWMVGLSGSFQKFWQSCAQRIAAPEDLSSQWCSCIVLEVVVPSSSGDKKHLSVSQLAAERAHLHIRSSTKISSCIVRSPLLPNVVLSSDMKSGDSSWLADYLFRWFWCLPWRALTTAWISNIQKK